LEKIEVVVVKMGAANNLTAKVVEMRRRRKKMSTCN